MIYTYTKNNLLENPHSYMYTSYQGVDFLNAYSTDRRAMIQLYAEGGVNDSKSDVSLVRNGISVIDKLFSVLTTNAAIQFRRIFNSEIINDQRSCVSSDDRSYLNKLIEPLIGITIDKEMHTLDLLRGLTATELLGTQDVDVKYWLDKLIQRFEVTKKIYQTYPSGFRKGYGSNESLYLYWLFSLLLGLFYVRTLKLKYLSSLLKVNDLLCSQSKDFMELEVPDKGMQLVLATELCSVSLLSKEMEVPFATE